MGAPFRSGYEMIGFVRGPLWKQDPKLIPRNLRAVIEHPWRYGSHPHHGAEKPVALCRQLLEWAGPGVVFDPFMGSGTSGVAAISLPGRRFIGIERDERYAETATRRLCEAERALDQVAMFPSSP